MANKENKSRKVLSRGKAHRDYILSLVRESASLVKSSASA